MLCPLYCPSELARAACIEPQIHVGFQTGWKGPLEIIYSSCACSYPVLLNISRDRDFTASLDNLCYCLTLFQSEKFCIMFNQEQSLLLKKYGLKFIFPPHLWTVRGFGEKARGCKGEWKKVECKEMPTVLWAFPHMPWTCCSLYWGPQKWRTVLWMQSHRFWIQTKKKNQTNKQNKNPTRFSTCWLYSW